jgi:hypothetical protein
MNSSRSSGQAVFYAKTWYHSARALVFTVLGLVSVILGPLFLFEILKRADGKPGTEAGIALLIIGSFMILLSLLGWFNVYARRKPLLRICREGLVVNIIGASSLDNVPLVPGILRVAWLILSLQGFKRQVGMIPWDSFGDAQVTGLPMMRSLVIVASIVYPNRRDQSFKSSPGSIIIFRESEFRDSLDKIAAAIHEFHSDQETRVVLQSWNE